MPTHAWQKSSYCGQGESCVHISADPGTIHLTESADPSHSVLTTTRTAFAALLDAVSARRPGR
ncbi:MULTISPECIES: DUF397 domain-containing protein [Streptomyces]|uniref:DUF397 domain-containing protein n=1 Tax=Streptomyces asoensis TaxID=249586 RepID=A0A6M4WQF1_9ACTN|nr:MULTISPECIES: DUF397 domain-containing protein [Streptomyces]KQX83195.1 toxin-antitoxin system, toxin component [Streptomyces sp. Root1310]QJT02358.1 DUF397 domain-containing protein [Streptomyces asoensis]